MPRVTVVLPVYNHAPYVEQTLLSLFEQDFRDFEIVAVDDGSSDSSLEILNNHQSRLRVLSSPHPSSHRGPAAARNIALRDSDSEYVAFMDADDLCSPERLSIELKKIESDRLDLVASALSYIDANSEVLPGEWRCPAYGANDYWGALLERNWIGTPSVLLRRSAIVACGGFDERFSHSEDYDLWLRIGASHRIGYIDTPLIQCRRHATNMSGDIDSHQAFERLALQRVDPEAARHALSRLHAEPEKKDEAWIWFLLRSGNSHFQEASRVALTRFPHSRGIWFAIAVFLHDSGHWEAARSIFTVLSGIDENDNASRHNAGVLFALVGDKRSAERYLNAALRERPDYYDARANLKALTDGGNLRLTRRPLRQSLVPHQSVAK